MNQQVNLRSTVEDALAATFEEVRSALPGGPAARKWREAAFASFAASGLPHRRIEAWKYTDLRRLMRVAAPPADDADPRALAALSDTDPLSGLERARIVIANGRYRHDLSDMSNADGVSAEDFAQVLEGDPDRTNGLASGDDPLVRLNTAFVQGGVIVTLAPDADPAVPVEIVHLTAVDKPAAVTLRVIVRIGENARGRIIETHRGPDGIAYQVNALTELDLGAGARLEWSRVQAEGDLSQHISSFFARLDRDAALNHLAVNGGAALWRWQGRLLVAGEGADAVFSAATMLGGDDHGDTKLTVTHAAGHSTSRELFKSVVDGRAQGAFQGLIEVNRDAQKTDARMMCQALPLSDEAQFASKPELEIFADDVQCGHGSTTGQLDEAHLFYLMSRGIPRPDAMRLLIEAFLADAIDVLEDSALAAALRGIVAARLARRKQRSSS